MEEYISIQEFPIARFSSRLRKLGVMLGKKLEGYGTEALKMLTHFSQFDDLVNAAHLSVAGEIFGIEFPRATDSIKVME